MQKLIKTADELRDIIKTECSRAAPWPEGADVVIWPDGASWKVVFHSVDLARDRDFEVRVKALSDHLRERIDLAHMPLIEW